MRALLFSILFVLPNVSMAQDHVVCADSVAEIEDALAVARSSLPGFSRVIIQVEQGSYNLTSSSILWGSGEELRRLYKSVQLLGGYNNGCTARNLDASNTLLGNTGSRRFYWVPKRNLTIQGFEFSAFAQSIQIENFTSEESTQKFELSNNRFVGGTGDIELAIDAGADASTIVFKNNEVFARDTDVSCLVYFNGDFQSGASTTLHMSNNTFAGNIGGDTVCMDDIDSPSFLNNIFYSNAGDDLVGLSGNGASYLFHNTYQSTAGLNILANVNNNSSNPLFVNYPAGDLRLQSSSPAVNSGIDGVPGGTGSVDVAGQDRQLGAAIDRGAHESSNAGVTTLVVTNTNDTGSGSLREAITLANGTPGLNLIQFSISGAGCPKTIQINSALPEITDALVIDAGTQPGSQSNTLDLGYNGQRCVLLRGDSSDIGLFVPGTAPANTTLWVKSMAFGGFGFSVFLAGGQGHLFQGNHFGVTLGPAGNTGVVAIYVADADDVIIGGSGPNERNVFARQIGSGEVIGAGVLIGATSEGTEVTNNFFGTEPNGVLPADNTYGLVSDGDDGLFIDNLIANAQVHGLRLRSNASNNLLQNSRLGLPVFCIGGCPDSSKNARGVLVEGNGNRVSNNEISSIDVGVRVTGNDNGLVTNLVYGGSISTPPIDIAGADFTANNNDGAANPPDGNRGINYPVLDQAVMASVGNTAMIKVTGSLATTNGDYRVYFFAGDRRLDPSSPLVLGFRCEGRDYLGYVNVQISNATSGNNGAASFEHVFDAENVFGRYLTAQTVRKTATVLTDSSEYGGCLEAPMFGDSFE
jgi:hypothetical protein